MEQITDDDIKKILMGFGEGLSFKDFEDCIKECLGEDYKDMKKRYEGGAGRKEDVSEETKEGPIANVEEEELHITLLRNLGEELKGAPNDVIKETGKIIKNAIDDGEDVQLYKFLTEFLSLLKSVVQNPTNKDNKKLFEQLKNDYSNKNLEVEKFFTTEITAKNKDEVSKTRSIIQHILSNLKLVKGLGKRFTAVLDKIKESSFGELVRKSTEKVRSIAKKKGIYIIGRKNRKFLGIKFLKSGSYSKKKNKKPNCKEYSYDQIRKMKNTKYKIDWKKSKLPELIDKMNIKDVKQKFGNFQFGFELLPQRGCGSKFGYTFPKGTTRGYGSALLYSKI